MWHRIVRNFNLPLDLPVDATVDELAGPELQRRIMHALRLNQNWHKTVPEIRRITRFRYHDGVLDEVHLLPGGLWLVGKYRQIRTGHLINGIAVWSLENVDDIYLATSFETPVPTRQIAAAITRQHLSIVICTGNKYA